MGPAAGPRPQVSFRVVRADGGPEMSVPMGGETLTCGTRADLTLPDDPFIAPVQARFFFSGQRLAIEDLGGGNGVFARLPRPAIDALLRDLPGDHPFYIWDDAENTARWMCSWDTTESDVDTFAAAVRDAMG